jgi:hypothetical protein
LHGPEDPAVDQRSEAIDGAEKLVAELEGKKVALHPERQ